MLDRQKPIVDVEEIKRLVKLMEEQLLSLNREDLLRILSAGNVDESRTPSTSSQVVVDPYTRRPGGRFIATTKEVLEYYRRGPENFTNLEAVDHSIRRKVLVDGFALQVDDSGFSIINSEAKGGECVVKRVEFDCSLSKSACFDYVKAPSQDILPNSILEAGPSSWLFSVYFPGNHALHTYGIKIDGQTLQLEYLYRVKLFLEGLVSPPFIVHGPATVYKGVDGKVHAYWYLEESDDVEPLFVSEPLEGDLKNPAIDKEGNLTFLCGDKSFSHAVFVEAYWQKHMERLKGGATPGAGSRLDRTTDIAG